MKTLGWYSLIGRLGEGYDIQYTEKDTMPRIVRGGIDIATIDFDEPCIEALLFVKWSYLPYDRDWVPFEVDLDDVAMPVIERVFRSRWEHAGFKLEDETISSCYYPDRSTAVAFPLAEMRVTMWPKSLEDAVKAIHFIEGEETEAWINESSPCL